MSYFYQSSHQNSQLGFILMEVIAQDKALHFAMPNHLAFTIAQQIIAIGFSNNSLEC